MTKAEERALEAYPEKIVSGPIGYEEDAFDINAFARSIFQEGYEQAEKELGWISVKDRLPEKRGYYFTCSDDNGYPQCIGVTLFDVAANEWYDDDDTYINIDYWMEVPQFIR